jgi:DNA polymerase-4
MTSAQFLHVDLDAFFASVEQLLDPTLRGKPVIVAGLGRRGVVAAASYEARAFGVHSAMPTGVARRQCPNGMYVTPRHGVYEEHSRRVMTILRDITPDVEQLSVDEAFLDVAPVQRLHGDAAEVAALVRRRVRDEAGLAISVGGATTKFLSKIASDMAKPDGVLIVPPGAELEFLAPLPVQKLWGVGPKTLAKLERIGVHTIGDVAALPDGTLEGTLGMANGRHLRELSRNIDARPIETSRETKSIGNEETFAHDICTRTAAERELLALSDRVAARLRAHDVAGRVVTLKARYGDFTTITRSRTLDRRTDLAAVVSATARSLLDDVDVERGVRLLGVHVSQLAAHTDDAQGVLDLGLADAEASAATGGARREAVERAVDSVRARFGNAAVTPAVLVRRGDGEGGEGDQEDDDR